MRLTLYIIAGIVSCLISWNVSLGIIDFVKFLQQDTLPFRPDFILLPILAPCLTVSMIVATIYLSNPIHGRSNKRIIPKYIQTALGIGGLAGLGASSITWILYQIDVPDWSVRMVAWSIIGLATGLAEGLSWYWLDKEALTSSKQDIQSRLQKSTLFGLLAGGFAALILEILRSMVDLQGYEDPLGFLILGVMLGICLNRAAAPNYQVALKAGTGFEKVDPKSSTSQSQDKPTIQHTKRNDLKIAPGNFEHSYIIEEGLSIRLPRKLDKPLLVGSSEQADIYLPNLPEEAAYLFIKPGEVQIRPLQDNLVQIQDVPLTENSTKALRHNQILTLYHQTNEDNEDMENDEEYNSGDRDEKYYCFRFYDRFLEPRA
ncbi:MAG: hypothetical protein MK105_19730 [Crocinitomicaceae bacterium]|nr:hypothetical protein [Crocinitomicaceae bacterium]